MASRNNNIKALESGLVDLALSLLANPEEHTPALLQAVRSLWSDLNQLERREQSDAEEGIGASQKSLAKLVAKWDAVEDSSDE